MEKSLWSSKTNLGEFKKLKGTVKTDVLIIGGGICGLLCAYFLKKSGVNCVVAEARKITCGTTCNTTAKITLQHGLIYNDLLTSLGKETALKYLHINQVAIDKYDELCKSISCDFKRLPSYTYSVNNRKKVEDEAEALYLLGINAELSYSSPLPIPIEALVCIKNQAQFNPLKFLKHISENLTIYEDTMVTDIVSGCAICNDGKIFANKIIVATHFPFLNKHGNYFLKLYQHRSYVLALENAQELDGMYVDEADSGLSFRNSDNLLLLGGGGARTGKSCGNWQELTEFKNKYYPHSEIKFKWATQDCMSLDKIPYIGQYSSRTPNLFVATGFNKWGMTSSMVSAMLLCDLVREIKNDYADIFSPSRSILKPQLFVNGIETISNFILPTTKRCSHLGCALKWNKSEHTWDCSCHGSRFENNGKLINNPAQKDIKI